MTPIQTISPAFASSAAPAATDTAQKTTLNSDFETFLKMLTVQMQNQDPLNPIESSEYAVQLATFSSVEQQVLTNDLLTVLDNRMGMMGMAQLSGWVGMEATASTPIAFNGPSQTLRVSLPNGADRAEMVVHDASGEVVMRRAVPAGVTTLEFDGLQPDGRLLPFGTYKVELESFSGDLPLGAVPGESHGLVVEAQNRNGETLLVMQSGQTVPASDVTSLRDPDL